MSSNPSFIVVFKDNVTPDQVQKYADEVNANGGQVTHQYGKGLNGFAAKIPESFYKCLQSDSLQGDSLIKYIEPDGVVTTQ